MSTRSLKDDNGVVWFPIIDIVGYTLKDTNENLKPSCTSWLRRNVPTGSVKKINIKENGAKKGCKFICICSDEVLTLSIYETHILNGGDFRDRWSLLPDRPALSSNSKKELAWRHLYKWSLAEHNNKLKISTTEICKLRNISMQYRGIFSKDPDGSLSETLAEIEKAFS